MSVLVSWKVAKFLNCRLTQTVFQIDRCKFFHESKIYLLIRWDQWWRTSGPQLRKIQFRQINGLFESTYYTYLQTTVCVKGNVSC